MAVAKTGLTAAKRRSLARLGVSIALSRLREDQPGASTLPCDLPRLGWPEPVGDDPVREVRTASAAEPPGRTPCREGVPLSLSTLADQLARAARCWRGCCAGSRRMSSRPSACTATTPSCRSWENARPIPGRRWVYLWTVPAGQGLTSVVRQSIGCRYLSGL